MRYNPRPSEFCPVPTPELLCIDFDLRLEQIVRHRALPNPAAQVRQEFNRVTQTEGDAATFQVGPHSAPITRQSCLAPNISGSRLWLRKSSAQRNEKPETNCG